MNEPENKSFLLSEEERARFIYWLERQIESSKGMLSQFEKLPLAVAEVMVAKEKRELAGYVVVLGILKSQESFSVGK